jgi:hypothetical protein
MKKVKLDADKKLCLEDGFSLHCPLSNTDEVEIVCGPWCAWFDVEEIVDWVQVPPTRGKIKKHKDLLFVRERESGN